MLCLPLNWVQQLLTHSDDLLERDTLLKGEKQPGLTGPVAVCAVVLLYSEDTRTFILRSGYVNICMRSIVMLTKCSVNLRNKYVTNLWCKVVRFSISSYLRMALTAEFMQ